MKMTMKKKLLDAALLTILFGSTSVVYAQQDDVALASSSEASEVRQQPTVSNRGGAKKASRMRLPGGGLIWATENPDIGLAELAISGPSYSGFDGNKLTKPVQFIVRSNYSSFVDKYELSIYRSTDSDQISPLVTIPFDVNGVSQTEWDGVLPAGHSFQAGDSLTYVLRAYDKQGNFDETYARGLQLVRPEEAERGQRFLTDQASKLSGTVLSNDQAQTQTLLDEVFAENGLRQQNIPIRGSRIRIQGQALPEGSLQINGESYPVDLERKFVAEYLVPVGTHTFDVDVQADNGRDTQRQLSINVSGNYFVAVALADITISRNKATGNGRDLALGDRTDSVLKDGRLAFYGKSKLAGRYLITGQADTGDKDIKHIFSGFTQAEPQDIFRSLDPEMYYPTYGDDSTVYRDVDTMGRFYLRMDWDKNQALWGNYNTGIDGTQYGIYSRSLYGAALSWRSNQSNRWGDARTQVRVFGSEAESAAGHTELLGTGGSLYYLKHTNILPGSEKIVLEIRDNTTGSIENRATLVRGTDYEVDNVQGRIILSRPLSQIAQGNTLSITQDGPLSGYEQRLVVDYEWVPDKFDDDNLVLGFRGKHWMLNDRLGIGATYIDEERAGGDDYSMKGADITLQAGKGTFLRYENTRTKANSTSLFYSDNGGLNFVELDNGLARKGTAQAVEARANFKELGWTKQDWTVGAWWRDVDEGFSSTRRDGNGQAITEYGFESLMRVNESISVYARHSQAERGQSKFTQSQLTGEWRVNSDSAVSGELRRVRTENGTEDTSGLLAALRYTQRFTSKLDMYMTVQATVNDDDGKYADNNAVTIGGTYQYGDMSNITLEATHGDRGDGYKIGAEHRFSPDHSLYGNYTHSNADQSDYDSFLNNTQASGLTVGQRWRLNNRVNMFNESQWLKEPNQTGLANTFGLDFYLGAGWTSGFTLQQGRLSRATDGETVYRKAISVNAGLTTEDINWQSKVEWRRDTGAEEREQWVTTNRATIKLNESWRLAGRFNYSNTEDKLTATNGAKFIEGNFGFAWRPWDSTRWAAFGRYTYTYDRASAGQYSDNNYDQKTQVVSLEGVYKADSAWEVALKAARRKGDVRFGRGSGAWYDSEATFLAGQMRYEFANRWYAMGEYRWLDTKDGGTRDGWLIGVDYDVTQWFRVGMGYSFASFSDDLTDFDYDHRGWFLNLVGSY